MPSVVFMRGVNVGGHKAFKPSELAGRLASLEVKSLGAAGTFVVRADASAVDVRRQFLSHIPFETELMICSGKDLAGLVALRPFEGKAVPKSDGQFVSVLGKPPGSAPKLPLEVPAGKDWQVRIIAVHRIFVVSLMRRVGTKLLYPNEVVERQLGVPATTRNWSTIMKIHEALC
ncbi:MAG: DUF1697 domain-containing protein [Candidatus Eiseniibacteriota bacterium]